MRSYPIIRLAPFALMLAGCGGGGGDVIDLNPGDGMPVETFKGMDVADLDNDGLIDVVAASRYFDGVSSGENRLNIFLQDAASPGTFLPRKVVVHNEGSDIWQLIVADLTLDGRPEILLKSITQDGFALFEQDPANPGSLLAPRRFGTPTDFRGETADSFAVGDIDGDLYPDVVVTAGDAILWFRQDAAAPGDFMAAVRAGTGEDAIHVADFNGDGLNDLVTFATNDGNDGIRIADTWTLHRQNPSAPGTFFARVPYFFDAFGWAMSAADLDGDSRMDVAINATSGDNEYLIVYLQTSFGSFVRQADVRTNLDGLLGDQAIADLDADGRPEIIAGVNTAALDPELLQIYRQDASGAYRAGALLTVPYPQVGQPFMYAVDVADLDADGQPDIVVSTGEVNVFFQRTGSPGTFDAPTRIAAAR